MVVLGAWFWFYFVPNLLLLVSFFHWEFICRYFCMVWRERLLAAVETETHESRALCVYLWKCNLSSWVAMNGCGWANYITNSLLWTENCCWGKTNVIFFISCFESSWTSMDLHHQPLNWYEFVETTQLEMCFSVLVNLDLRYYKMNTLAKTRKKCNGLARLLCAVCALWALPKSWCQRFRYIDFACLC